MKISVIVPFLNEEKYIERCVNSLLDQDFPKGEYEVIFIDNCSRDASAGIVEKYPAITLIKEKEPNVYAARNAGLRLAKGNIIAFTDADCVVSKNWLKVIEDELVTKGNDIVLGKRTFPKDSSRFLGLAEDYSNAYVEYVFKGRHEKSYFGYTNNMAVKADIFKNIGFFNKSFPVTGDSEFVRRYNTKYGGEKILYSPAMQIVHLEVETVRDLMRKQYSYGEWNSAAYKSRVSKDFERGLKFNNFKYALNGREYTFWQMAALFFLSFGLRWAYKAGNIKGKVSDLLRVHIIRSSFSTLLVNLGKGPFWDHFFWFIFSGKFWEYFLRHIYLGTRDVEVVCNTKFNVKMKALLRDFLQVRVFLFGIWEPSITRLIQSILKPGDVFLDIGANVGYYSLLASNLVGENGVVFSVEASSGFCQAIQQNAELNKMTNIEILNYAAWDSEGEGLLHHEIQENNLGTASLAGRVNTTTETVRLGRIDDIIPNEYFDKIRLIKIDTEGAESHTIRGLSSILEKNTHLDVIVEVIDAQLYKFNSSSSEVCRMLKEYGFKMYVIDNDYRELEEYMHSSSRSTLDLKPMDDAFCGKVDVFCTRAERSYE